MPTVITGNLIAHSLRLLGVHSPSQPLSADMSETGRMVLNALISSLGLDRLMIPTRPKVPLTLVPGKNPYSWGTGRPTHALDPVPPVPGDIPLAPPIRLEAAMLEVGDSGEPYEWPIEVLTQAEYAQGVTMKGMASQYPSLCYLERTEPYHQLFFWPVPQRNYVVNLYPWIVLERVTSIVQQLDLPEGYALMLVHQLALHQAPEYAKEPSAHLLRLAEASRAAVATVNVTVGRLTSDYGGAFRQSEVPVVDLPSFLAF
jgi:hypothetical protein